MDSARKASPKQAAHGYVLDEDHELRFEVGLFVCLHALKKVLSWDVVFDIVESQA